MNCDAATVRRRARSPQADLVCSTTALQVAGFRRHAPPSLDPRSSSSLDLSCSLSSHLVSVEQVAEFEQAGSRRICACAATIVTHGRGSPALRYSRQLHRAGEGTLRQRHRQHSTVCAHLFSAAAS